MIERVIFGAAEAAMLFGVAAFVYTGAVSHFNLGNIAGIGICLVLFVMCIARHQAVKLIAKLWDTRGGRIFLCTAGVLIAAAIIICTVILVLIAKHADMPPYSPQTVILLGCGMKNGGPSQMMRQRVDAAYGYMTENPGVICIASGGRGDDEPVSEAEMMRSLLIDKGIDPSRVVLEDRSVSTYTNLVNSQKIMEERDLGDKAVIITSEYHQLRASMLAKRVGIQAYSRSSRTSRAFLPACLIREIFGVIYTFLGGK